MQYLRLRVWAIILALLAGMALGAEAFSASRSIEPTHLTVEVPASAVLIGNATTRARWSRRIQASPDEDGEFEILIARNRLANIEAPRCPSPWLLARMPAVLPPTDSASHVLPKIKTR